MPVTFYRTLEELPEFTDYSMKGRTYRYMQQEALYPFGYGLSYTTFAFEDVKADTQKVGKDGVDITATVKNTGNRKGAQTVQVYVKVDREGTPNAQLKSLKKIELDAGEEKTVILHLPLEAFGLFDEEGMLQTEKGNVLVYVGGQAPDTRSEKLTGQKAAKLVLTIE